MNNGRKQKRLLVQMIAQANHVIWKDIEKTIHVLTSHIGKLVELLFFEVDNWLSQRHKCIFIVSLYCYKNDTRYREWEILLQNYRHRKSFSEWHHNTSHHITLSPVHPVSLFITFSSKNCKNGVNNKLLKPKISVEKYTCSAN